MHRWLVGWLCGCILLWIDERLTARTTSDGIVRTAAADSTRLMLIADPQMEGDAREAREGWYGVANNLFNDAYFSWVVERAQQVWQPHAAAVLGDLFSSQMLSDAEFRRRWRRYSTALQPLLHDPQLRWLLNVSGNHDIGYSAELHPRTMQRFRRFFGPINGRYQLAGHRVLLVNSMGACRHAHLRL